MNHIAELFVLGNRDVASSPPRSRPFSRLWDTLWTIPICAMFILCALVSDAHASRVLRHKPHRLFFGRQVVRTTSPPKQVSISNAGTRPIKIRRIVTRGNFIQSNSCLGVLAPGANCTISIAFSPKIRGHKLGRLKIFDNARYSPQEVFLFGRGRKPQPIVVPFDPVPGANTSDLIAVSPLHESPIGTNTNATFRIAKNTPEIVGLMDTSRNFGWTAVSPSWFTNEGGYVGPLSTAVQMVFIVPGIFTDNVATQSEVVSMLAGLPEVVSLADALQANAGAPDPLSVPAVQSAYQTAVTAALSAVSTLPPSSSLRAEINLNLAPTSGEAAPTGSAVAGATIMSAATVSYNGPISLNDADAHFDLTRATSAGVRVQPAWNSSPGGLLQGLYWIAAMYPVDTPPYGSFDDLSTLWNGAPWQTDISLAPPQPFLSILPPKENIIDSLDVVNDAVSIASSLLNSSNAGDNGTLLPANGVYALHLYTCGFGQSNPPSFGKDEGLVEPWQGEYIEVGDPFPSAVATPTPTPMPRPTTTPTPTSTPGPTPTSTPSGTPTPTPTPTPGPAGPWPMFHHDIRHTGLSQYSATSDTGAEEWEFVTGNEVTSSPTIGSDGTIYVGSVDSNLYAINRDGSLKWKFATGASISYSSPAIASDGTIYVGSLDYNLYAINPNGTLKWKFTTGSGIDSSPAIGSDGTIYVGSGDHYIYAINPDGTLKWKFATDELVHSSPAIASNGTIYVGSNDLAGNVYAINPDGTLKWKFATGGAVDSSPAIGSDGTIYVGSGDYLYAINPNGNQRCRFFQLAWLQDAPAVSSDGTIIFGGDYLYALNPDCSVKWQSAALAVSNISSPAIASDGTIFVGSANDGLYAIH